MARAYYTCPTCGKEIAVTGCNRRDADSKAAWYAKQNRPCWDCQKKAEQEAADAQAAELGLPALEGTPKQIAWAETIRADFLASAQAKKNADYAEWLKKQTSAKLFIDNREDGLLRYWQVSVMLDMTEAEQDEERKCAMLVEILNRVSVVFFMDKKALNDRFNEVRGDRDVIKMANEKEAQKLAEKYTLEELEEKLENHAGFLGNRKAGRGRWERAIAIKKAEMGIEEAPAEEVKSEAQPAAAPVKEWRKFAVNAQNVLTDTGKVCKIAFPHSSELDGYCFWISSKLVRGGRHSYENTVSMHKDMTFTAKKYGAGKHNKAEVIDERPVSQDEIIAAFGGEVSGKFGPKQDVEEVVTHTPEPLAPVEIEAAPELVR